MTSVIPASERATNHVTVLRLPRYAEENSPTKRRFGIDAGAQWKTFEAKR